MRDNNNIERCMSNHSGRFSKEMEDKFLKDLEEIDEQEQKGVFEEDRLEESYDRYYEEEKRRVEKEIQSLKTRKVNPLVEELKRNIERETEVINNFQTEIGELHDIVSCDQHTIDPNTIKLIKEKVSSDHTTFSLSPSPAVPFVQLVSEVNVVCSLSLETIREEQFLSNKISQAQVERQLLGLAREDQLSMKYQMEVLSRLFEQRFQIISPKVFRQSPFSIACSVSKSKRTFTSLKPLPNTEENVLPRNAPQIALKNLKASKGTALKAAATCSWNVQPTKIDNRELHIGITENQCSQCSTGGQLSFLLFEYLRNVNEHIPKLKKLSGSYKPKFLKGQLEESEKNIALQIQLQEGGNKDLLEAAKTSNCCELRSLAIKFENVSSLQGVSKFKRLEQLCLPFNKIISLQEIQNCQMLIEINVSHNLIADAHMLSSLPWLRLLDISHNQLQAIDLQATSLQWGYFSNNQIKQIQQLGTSIRVLHVDYNKLHELGSIQQLHLLEELNISHNSLHKLGDISRLFLLKRLNCSYNLLIDLPNKFVALYLHSLDISNNMLCQLSTLFLPCLAQLYLQNNRIHSRCDQAIYLPNLRELNIDSNQLEGFSAIYSLLRFSHNLEMIQYGNNDYFLDCREKVRELYEHLLCQNLSHLKILNQSALSIGLRKYYQANYSDYMSGVSLFKQGDHKLHSFETFMRVFLRQSEACRLIIKGKLQFACTDAFVQHEYVKKVDQLVDITKNVLQAHGLQTPRRLFIIHHTVFHQHDSYEERLRSSQHMIRSLVVSKRYRKHRRIKLLSTHPTLVQKTLACIRQCILTASVTYAINKFANLVDGNRQSQAALLIQKKWRGYRARKHYLKVLRRLKQGVDQFDIEEIDLQCFENFSVDKYSFDFESIPLEDLIIKPEVFLRLADRQAQQEHDKPPQNKPQAATKPHMNNFLQPVPEEDHSRQDEEHKRKLMQAWGIKSQQTYQAMQLKERKKQKDRLKEMESKMTAAQRYEKFKNRHH